MTASGLRDDYGDPGGIRLWAPNRLRASRSDGDTDVLRQNVHGLLSDLIMDDLGVDAEFHEESAGCDTIELVSAVDGFADALSCRIGMSEGKWLVRELYGAGPSVIGDKSVDLCGPIVQQALNGLLLLFVEKFCEAGSSIGAIPLTRMPRQWTTGSVAHGNLASGIKEKTRICVEPCGIRVEYELSLTDLRRLSSGPGYPESSESIADAERQREFESRVDAALVRLSAVLGDRETTLGEIKGWRVGSVVQLASTPASIVNLTVEGRSLFECELARDNGYFALRLLNGRE